jgi:hypothetical protein
MLAAEGTVSAAPAGPELIPNSTSFDTKGLEMLRLPHRVAL